MSRKEQISSFSSPMNGHEAEKCEQCIKAGRSGQLYWYQTTFDSALLLCSNKLCLYPLDVPDSVIYEKKRKLTDIPVNNNKRKKKAASSKSNKCPPMLSKSDEISEDTGKITLLPNSCEQGSSVVKPLEPQKLPSVTIITKTVIPINEGNSVSSTPDIVANLDTNVSLHNPEFIQVTNNRTFEFFSQDPKPVQPMPIFKVNAKENSNMPKANEKLLANNSLISEDTGKTTLLPNSCEQGSSVVKPLEPQKPPGDTIITKTVIPINEGNSVSSTPDIVANLDTNASLHNPEFIQVTNNRTSEFFSQDPKPVQPMPIFKVDAKKKSNMHKANKKLLANKTASTNNTSPPKDKAAGAISLLLKTKRLKPKVTEANDTSILPVPPTDKQACGLEINHPITKVAKENNALRPVHLPKNKFQNVPVQAKPFVLGNLTLDDLDDISFSSKNGRADQNREKYFIDTNSLTRPRRKCGGHRKNPDRTSQTSLGQKDLCAIHGTNACNCHTASSSTGTKVQSNIGTLPASTFETFSKNLSLQSSNSNASFPLKNRSAQGTLGKQRNTSRNKRLESDRSDGEVTIPTSVDSFDSGIQREASFTNSSVESQEMRIKNMALKIKDMLKMKSNTSKFEGYKPKPCTSGRKNSVKPPLEKVTDWKNSVSTSEVKPKTSRGRKKKAAAAPELSENHSVQNNEPETDLDKMLNEVLATADLNDVNEPEDWLFELLA